MQTQKPALSLLSSLNTNAPVARQGNNSMPEVSFNQVLSREVSRQPEHQPERPTTPPPSQNNSKPAEAAGKDKNTGPLPPQNQAQNENASGATSQSNNASGNQSAGNASSKASDGSDGSDKSDKADPAQSDAVAAATADPTAALLALVASFNNPAAAGSKAGPAAGAEASAVANVGTKTDKSTDATALAPQAAATDDQPADPFAALLPKDGKVTPDAKAEVADTAPKIATGKTDNGTKLAKTDSKPDAAQQVAASTDNANATPVAPRTAIKVDAAVPKTQSDSNSANTITAVAQASAAANTPAIAKLQAQLAPRVGNPGWDQALGQHVVYMAGQGTQTASLTLNPPDLGPLQVVLNISNDQANASFTAAQPEVRAALEAAMPRLREMMSEAGISLGSATVGTSLPNQQQSTPGEQGRQHGGGSMGSAGPDIKDEAPRTVITRPVNTALGMVDTFV